MMGWEGLWKTLRDDTFAIWFGWSLIIAIVVFPLTATIQSCWSDSVRESIEMAKLEAQDSDRPDRQGDLMKWMIARGVHPLVSRCAILGSPLVQCRNMIANLEEGERSTIKEMLANPFVGEAPVAEVVIGPATPPKDPMEYVAGLDFGLRSPTK